jgi:hypothetical protein
MGGYEFVRLDEVISGARSAFIEGGKLMNFAILFGFADQF